MKFDELAIDNEFKETVQKLGFTDLTAIQEKCIPEILSGKDVVGQAETGSGKTIAFALPILNEVFPDGGLQVLVLTPTRELCVQVADVFKDFGDPVGLNTAAVYGGVSINPQIDAIKRAHIVVGTPGRILDHLSRKTLKFDKLYFFVLDEADKMFEMGFIEDVEKIMSHTPKDIQSIMFSATVSEGVYAIMGRYMRDPTIIRTKSEVDPTKLKQTCYDIKEQKDKFPLLVHLLKNETKGLAIVFCATRGEVEYVARNLRNQQIKASAIHGGMTQSSRLDSLERLKKEHIDVLVATDVAARGLDIKKVTHIYNYDVPGGPKEYVHRIGRTARAGEDGDAVTLLTPRDYDDFRGISSEFGKVIKIVPAPQVEVIQMLSRGRKEAERRPGQGYGGGFRGGRSGGGRGGGGRSGGGRSYGGGRSGGGRSSGGGRGPRREGSSRGGRR